MLRALALLGLVACGDSPTAAPDAGSLPPGFINPGDSSFGDELGSAVVEGPTEVFVGVPGDDGPPDAEGNDPDDLQVSGAVLILDPVTFETVEVLRAPTPRRGARFGSAIAVSADLLAVGAPGDFNPDPEAPVRDATGAVYVFSRQGAGWVPLGEPLVPEGARAGDRFGYAVSLAGNRLIVGAPGDDRSGDSTGGLYIFSRSGDQFIPGL